MTQPNIVHRLGRWNVVAALAACLMLNATNGRAEPFSETWESYTNDKTPYGGWTLEKGTWGIISDTGRGGGKCYLTETKATTRIRHKVDVSKAKEIVVQGWLYDSGDSRSTLGLTDESNSEKNSLIRIGTGAPGRYETYAVVIFDHLQKEGPIVIDTKMPYEKGWHFMRLGIMSDRTVSYQVWNAAQTKEAKGTFAWVFDKAKLNYVTVGAVGPTRGMASWDDINVGSLKEVGAAPHLPDSSAKQVEPEK